MSKFALIKKGLDKRMNQCPLSSDEARWAGTSIIPVKISMHNTPLCCSIITSVIPKPWKPGETIPYLMFWLQLSILVSLAVASLSVEKTAFVVLALGGV
jgi:hypothetical protein